MTWTNDLYSRHILCQSISGKKGWSRLGPRMYVLMEVRITQELMHDIAIHEIWREERELMFVTDEKW